MTNRAIHILEELRQELYREYQHERAFALVMTKLDEAELWASRCTLRLPKGDTI